MLGISPCVAYHLAKNNEKYGQSSIHIFTYEFQVLAVSETHERSNKRTDNSSIPGFKNWKTMRGGADKQGGGLSILYKEHLNAHEWRPQYSK